MATLTAKSPAELLEDIIKQKNLTQGQAADLIGISRQYLNGIINGKYPFTADLGLKLTEPLGTTPQFWNESIRSYDGYLQSDQGREAKRTKDEEALVLDLELQTAPTLVNHQIHAAMDTGFLRVEPPVAKGTLQPTALLLSLDQKGFRYTGGGSPEEVALRPWLVLRRGETLATSTREKIGLPTRLRGRVLGLFDALASQCLLLSCAAVLEPGRMLNHLSFSLTNVGPFEVRLVAGDPCIAVGFEFLAQEPLEIE